jgi:hypothetical protein
MPSKLFVFAETRKQQQRQFSTIDWQIFFVSSPLPHFSCVVFDIHNAAKTAVCNGKE